MRRCKSSPIGNMGAILPDFFKMLFDHSSSAWEVYAMPVDPALRRFASCLLDGAGVFSLSLQRESGLSAVVSDKARGGSRCGLRQASFSITLVLAVLAQEEAPRGYSLPFLASVLETGVRERHPPIAFSSGDFRPAASLYACPRATVFHSILRQRI